MEIEDGMVVWTKDEHVACHIPSARVQGLDVMGVHVWQSLGGHD
jgi:hypothetical protein